MGFFATAWMSKADASQLSLPRSGAEKLAHRIGQRRGIGQCGKKPLWQSQEDVPERAYATCCSQFFAPARVQRKEPIVFGPQTHAIVEKRGAAETIAVQDLVRATYTSFSISLASSRHGTHLILFAVIASNRPVGLTSPL